MEAEAFVLCRTRRGVAMRCACCQQVEITLGNAVLCLDAPDLDGLLEIIESFEIDRGEGASSAKRVFLIRPQHGQAAFAFSREEILELRELVQGARARVCEVDVLLAPAWPRFSDERSPLN